MREVTAEKKGYRGYIFSRDVDGQQLIPQRIQNLTIRDYLEKKGKRFLLSATEYSFKNSFMILRTLVEDAELVNGVVFFSTHHLPPNKEDRNTIYNLVRNGAWEVHFALEELVLKQQRDIDLLEDILLTRKLSLKESEILKNFSSDYLSVNPNVPWLKQLADRLSISSITEMARFPKYFEIETTNKCNARCPMCSIDNFSSREFSDELWDRLVQEFAKHGDWVEKVALFRDGEPLLDKKLESRIRDLRRVGIKRVSFSTNGTYLTRERGRSLIEAGLNEIMLSTDGITKATFEKVRLGLKFEQVQENFVNFIKLRDEMKADVRICVRMVLQPDNIHEYPEWLAFWKSQTLASDSVYAKKFHTWGNQHTDLRVPEEANRDLEPCISPFSTMVIKISGHVAQCGVDYKTNVNMGDLSLGSIQTIWNSPKFRELRDLHATRRRNEVSMCVGCKIWSPEWKI